MEVLKVDGFLILETQRDSCEKTPETCLVCQGIGNRCVGHVNLPVLRTKRKVP